MRSLVGSEVSTGKVDLPGVAPFLFGDFLDASSVDLPGGAPFPLGVGADLKDPFRDRGFDRKGRPSWSRAVSFGVGF